MKKVIGFISAILMFAPFGAFAYTLQDDCSSAIDPSACSAEQATLRAQQGGGVPTLIMMPWGLTGGQTPTFAVRTSVTDRYANKYTCPDWFPQVGCYDITNTQYYLNQVHGFLNIK